MEVGGISDLRVREDTTGGPGPRLARLVVVREFFRGLLAEAIARVYPLSPARALRIISLDGTGEKRPSPSR
jgi:hypothetical protein